VSKGPHRVQAALEAEALQQHVVLRGRVMEEQVLKGALADETGRGVHAASPLECQGAVEQISACCQELG
jgi:hypothetical protein